MHMGVVEVQDLLIMMVSLCALMFDKTENTSMVCVMLNMVTLYI